MLTILGHQNEEAHGLSKACNRNQLCVCMCVCVISAMDYGNCSTGGGGGRPCDERVTSGGE